MKRIQRAAVALFALTCVLSAVPAGIVGVNGRTHVACGASAEARASTSIPFDSDAWVLEGGSSRKEAHLGRQSLFLGGGAFAHLKDVEFEDGTIEVDVSASMPRAFLGIVFRFESRDAHEIVYLRPQKSGLDDATQYTPALNGAHPWQLYSGPGFTAAAEIPRGRWLHVRIEIKGLVGRVFLDNAAEPVLVIKDLKRGYTKGTVGLWGSAGGGHFSDFKYVKAEPAASREPRTAEQPPAGTLTKWELSDAFDTKGKNLDVAPTTEELRSLKWESVTTEPPGMVVIDRVRRSPNVLPPYAADFAKRAQAAPAPRAVYARVYIDSDREQLKRLHVGYSDEATVFLNGRALFKGRSAFRFRDPGFLGIMDVENDAVYLPLRKGRNELLLFVADFFGGWGFICRLDDMSGVKIE